MMTTLLLSIIFVSWIAISLSGLLDQLFGGPSESYELIPVRVRAQSDRGNVTGETAYRNR